MKKKQLLIGAAVAVACVVLGVGIWIFSGKKDDGGNVVYVNTVESILSLGSGNGMQNRYAGLVESQEDWKLERGENQVIEEILVTEGDQVTEGTPLVRYNMENAQVELSQAKLELERIDNDITNLKEQIKTLETEKKGAEKESKLDYTIRIQTAQTDMKKNEYEKKSKTTAVQKLETTVANSTVVSKISGIVKKINKGNNQVMDSGSDNALITILKTGDVRIKGTVNEQNISSLVEGMELIIRSRVDEKLTWKGKITKIDREAPLSNNNNMMMGNGDNSAQSSNYPFYVELENTEGLMLGQHVYMELDMGQEEKKEGLWLESYFIEDLDTKPYVWAANSRGRLGKKYITLGEFDEEIQKYEIKDGLKAEDQITFPEDGLKEGMNTKIGEAGQLGQSNPEVKEGEMTEEGMPEGGTPEGDMSGEGMPEEGMKEEGIQDGKMPEEGMTEGMTQEGMTGEEVPQAGMNGESMPEANGTSGVIPSSTKAKALLNDTMALGHVAKGGIR